MAYCTSKLIIGWLISFNNIKEWMLNDLKFDKYDIEFYNDEMRHKGVSFDGLPSNWIISSCSSSNFENHKYYLYFNLNNETEYLKCIELLTKEQIKIGEEFAKKLGGIGPIKMEVIESWC